MQTGLHEDVAHHLRMELAGTYISEGLGVICACVNAKEEV